MRIQILVIFVYDAWSSVPVLTSAIVINVVEV